MRIGRRTSSRCGSPGDVTSSLKQPPSPNARMTYRPRPHHICRIALVGLTTFLAAGCKEAVPAEDRPIAQHSVTRFDTLVTTESGRIGRPAQMAVGLDGRVWLGDAMNHHLLVTGPDGATETVGRQGGGPGEFNRPNALHVSEEGVIAYDFGNRRIQWFDLDGTFRDSETVDAGQFVPASLNGQGDMVVPRLGQDGHLARILRRVAVPVDIGTARGPMPAGISMSAVRQQAARREIPEVFANNVLPVRRADGGAWLIVQTEGVVERYDPDGELIWSRPLPEQEVAAARERFYRIGDDEALPVTIPWTARDGAEVNGHLWLLTDHPETGSSILVVDGETGDATARHPLALGSPAWAFAVDPDRGFLFVSLTDEANLLWAPLPESE
jgi:hypothetical protein